MDVQLASAVLRYLGEIRSNPALAVDPGRLAELERWASQEMGHNAIATSAPMAPLTWTLRTQLLATADESAVVELDTFGRPVEIVGFLPSVLALQADPAVEPPLKAFDVNISRTQGDTRNITSGNQTAENPAQQPLFSGLDAVSMTVGNRLIALKIREPRANLSFQWRWAIDAAARAALGYSNVQITMNIAYMLLTDDERR